MPPEDRKYDWQDMPMKVYLDGQEIGVTVGDTAMAISMEANFQGKRRRMKERAMKLLWHHVRDLSGKGILLLKENVL